MFFVGDLVVGVCESFGFDVIDMIFDILLGDLVFFGVLVVEFVVGKWFVIDLNEWIC